MTTVPKVLECGITLEVYEVIDMTAKLMYTGYTGIIPPKFRTGTAFLNWLNSLR